MIYTLDGTKMTEFYDPQSLKHTMWLHYWGIKSTSPYKNAVVFTERNSSAETVTRKSHPKGWLLFLCCYNPSTIVPMVPLPDNGVPAKPVLWGEFTGEASLGAEKPLL